MNILVFPSCIESAKPISDRAKDFGIRVIGASSINDPYKHLYDHWEILPFIGDSEFLSCLQEIIEKHNIEGICSPHSPSYLRLKELLNFLPSVNLIGKSPWDLQLKWVRNALEPSEIRNTSVNIPQLNSPISIDSSRMQSSIIAQAAKIYGECSSEKIRAICEIFTNCPKRGDVVEIGAFFGKSAFVLNRLASFYEIGTTLVVDPWEADSSVQSDSPNFIQKLSYEWDWEAVFEGFLLSMQSIHARPFNYLRAKSAEASQIYGTSRQVSSPEFGITDLFGKISVLHIDGNHDEASVQLDFEQWEPFLMPGAWIIFDDYDWSHGKGPYTTVQRLVEGKKWPITNKFISGGAAFIKLGEQK